MPSVNPSSAAPPAAPAAPAAAARPAQGAGLKTPDWVKDAVFYQVFPERFRNGDTRNDPPGTKPWGSPPANFEFQGGDLNGLTDRLGYLGKLGVNSLYLNPIFESPSNHKYDVADYRHVDDNFGGDAAFDALSAKAHAQGMKLILDGVFNHTSNESVWFKDVRDRGPKSPYWSWYTVNRWPIHTWTDERGVLRSNDYKGWGAPELGGPYATLPELHNLNPDVMKELVTGDDSVIRHWLKNGKVDGWRMDVADEVEPEFWRNVRTVVKHDNPDAYLVAENWHDASSYLKGDEFDGAMNYQFFQQPAVDFFAKKQISADDFAARLNNPYPREAKLAMFNILDSHDTPRFITQAGGDWYRQRPAAIFQMTYQGAPVIYYGDEVGMEGGGDPDSRRAMDWNAADKAVRGDRSDRSGQLFGLYQKLIDTRKGVDALRRGDFQVLATHNDNGTIAYRRWVDGDARDAVVAINNSTSGKPIHVPVGAFAADGASYTDALSGAKYVVKGGALDLPSVDGNYGAVLVRDAAGR